MATDSSGNVYVAGYFSGINVNLDPGGSDIHSSNGGDDVFISKFNSSGVFQWTRTWGGEGFDDGTGVATDGSGNVYVTGYFNGTDVNFNPDGSDLHSSNGVRDIFISKFNSNGTFQWARTWGGTGDESGAGVAADISGNTYVTGYFNGADVNFNPDGSDLHSALGQSDIFLSKYDSSGAFVWALTWGGADFDNGYAVATYGSDIVYVAGKFRGANVNLNPGGSDIHNSHGGCDAFVSEFNSNGVFQWAHSWGGTSYDFTYGVAADSSGNAYVTGMFQGTNVNLNPDGSDLHFSNGFGDVFLIKFNPGGVFQWARTWGGTGYEEGRGVAPDSSGSVYVTGSFDGTNVNFDPDGWSLHSSNGSADYFISKFDSDGVFKWARTAGGTMQDQGRSAATDNSGNVYITGYFYGTDIDFDPDGSDLHSSNGDGDVFFSKFLPGGYW